MWYELNEDNTVTKLPNGQYSHFSKSTQIKRDKFDEDTILSTIFLGLDHNHKKKGEPILFESMIFSDNSRLNAYQKRYTTYEEALIGHNKLIKVIKYILNGEE